MKTVTAIRQDDYGRGLVDQKDKICFVEGLLPDEEAIIQVDQEKKNYRLAHVVKLLRESDQRVIPNCPYASTCGGCQLLHQDYVSQLRFKKNKVEHILSKFAKIDLLPDQISIISSSPFHYRNKITLHGKDGKLGLKEAKSNQIVPIQKCAICEDAINRMIPSLQKLQERTKGITSIMIRTFENQVMIALSGNIKEDILQEFYQANKVTSFYYNGLKLFGEDTISVPLHQLVFRCSAKSFFQVNTQNQQKLYDLVLDVIEKKKPTRLLDLYCGTGTMTLLASIYAKEVIGIEVVPEAIQDAKKNQQINKIQNVSFICGRVEDFIKQFQQVDLVIVDPPRSGLDHLTRQSLLSIKPDTICYVSCDPITLARDLAELKEQYEIEKFTLVDMFPNTYHVECVALLCLKNTLKAFEK